MQVVYGGLPKWYVSCSYITERLLTITKPVPINSSFPDLCNLLAIEGGKLLVSVLRDMISDKVSCVLFKILCKSLTSNSRFLPYPKLQLKDFHLHP